jgi:multiple antibiotic resistance protein
MNIFWIAFTLFIVIDAVGNIPIFITILKKVPEKKQYKIITRELIIALAIIILFNYLGSPALEFLNIEEETVSIAGGVILFLLGLKMVFPPDKEEEAALKKIQEPFIVPLAVPLIAGPAVLATVMIFSNQISQFKMLGAITMAWGASLLVLLLSPLATKKLGDKGIIAIERLMGLILLLMAVQMFMTGIKSFFALGK